MKILAVDDDPVSQLSLSGAIKTLGHEPFTAIDGIQAWDMLDADRSLRVVVCDWRMPHMDGLELCQRVRKHREDYVSFILLTQVEPSPENRKTAYEAGIDDFLTKPVQLAELDHRLRVALRILEHVANPGQGDHLAICCYCKDVREDEDTWKQIESIVTKRTGLRFSHTVCPRCYEEQVEPQLQTVPKK